MTDCCESSNTPHLVVVGGGSAAFSAAIEAQSLGARVTIVNDGLPMGGTCVNVGCVPSKFLLRAAEAHHVPSRRGFDGIEGESRLDYRKVVEQKRGLVDELQTAKYADIIESHDAVSYRQGEAHFESRRRVVVDGEVIEPDRILVATGASPGIPSIEGLDEVDYLTNETAFELETPPDSLAVIGGGYVGLECAQLFSRFGTDVTVLDHTDILPGVARDVSAGLADCLRDEGIAVTEGAEVVGVRSRGTDVELRVEEGDGHRTVGVDEVLLATGRRPNTDRLNGGDAGIELDREGFVETDESLETAADGVFAAGDVIGEPMYVYTAAYEGKLAARNALGDGRSSIDYGPLPWVVFTDPQVAGVGLDERRAAEEGFEPQATTLPLSEVPRAIAARDTRGSIKLIRDVPTDRLLGGRIVAPEGSELLMELAMAIRHETTVDELVDTLHPYLTLSEGIRLAALTFDKSVDELSCCAG
ncbi:MAG: mercury(II) reductase [Bradymonadaceae bacterium]